RRRALLHGVVDIEQLEVEEDLLASLEQRLAKGEAVAAIERLVADLVEAGGIAEALHQPLRFSARVEIEGDDQRAGHGGLHQGDAVPSHIAANRASVARPCLGARRGGAARLVPVFSPLSPREAAPARLSPRSG